ncbi:hypothetical protein QFZ98_001506 [Paraburkholderia youngii]
MVEIARVGQTEANLVACVPVREPERMLGRGVGIGRQQQLTHAQRELQRFVAFARRAAQHAVERITVALHAQLEQQRFAVARAERLRRAGRCVFQTTLEQGCAPRAGRHARVERVEQKRVIPLARGAQLQLAQRRAIAPETVRQARGQRGSRGAKVRGHVGLTLGR